MYGHTALMLASEWLDAEIVRMLLEAGAEVDVRDTDGKTALHYALRGGAENIRVLLEFGADVNAQARNGYTPLTYLASQAAPDPEMVEVLQAAGGFVNHHALVKERVDEILTLFMFGGADTITSIPWRAGTFCTAAAVRKVCIKGWPPTDAESLVGRLRRLS